MSKRGAKHGNIHAAIHNVYLKKLLDADEIKVYNALYSEVITNYGLDGRPVDQMLLSIAVMDYVRAMRGYLFEKTNKDADVSEAIERATRSLRNNLSEMGITGKYKTIDNAGASLSGIFALLTQQSGGTP